jgi:hypothetical protein
VLTAFIDTCDPINTTGMSHLEVTLSVQASVFFKFEGIASSQGQNKEKIADVFGSEGIILQEFLPIGVKVNQCY